jgi:glycerate kinase
MRTSTYGTGQMVKHALEKGAQHIMLGLGGSATNDGGTGLLAALGYRFMDAAHKELKPCGASLEFIECILPPEKRIDASFTIACDVKNPLLGPSGSARTYAAQKGATHGDIELLERGMEHFARVLEKQTNLPIANIPGAGAAGGTAAGLMLLPHVKLQKGTDIVLQYSNFFHHLSKADFVLTGEGSFDAQTLHGKVVFAVAQACQAHGIPCVAICGKVNADEETIKRSGLTWVVSISGEDDDSFGKAGELVKEKVREFVSEFMKKNRRKSG